MNKATRKQRTQREVDEIIRWLTGYTAAGLKRQLASGDLMRAGNGGQRAASLAFMAAIALWLL